MARPLDGVKVVEVAMWAAVPSAGGLLADMGADVIKIEAPGGDPIRALTTSGTAPGAFGFTSSWETYNRSKRSVILDFHVEGATDVLDRLLKDADVFLTSLLPASRRKLGIDLETLRARHPHIIYAAGSGHGVFGPEAEKGGYDYISFWSRAGVSSGVTPYSEPYPLPMPSGAFGDCTTGSMLAGGICAALYRKAKTGEGSVVDASLLSCGMWSMQSHITSAMLQGISELPRKPRSENFNPLSNPYRTSDGRFVVLCMLQGSRYWPRFCEAAGRPDLIDDPRFATDEARAANVTECVAVLDEIFAARTLEDWKAILGSQEGPWGVVERAGDLHADQQVQANSYVQTVDYGDGRAIRLVTAPVQFDREPLQPRPAPALGVHSEEVLAGVGYSEDEIIDLKVAGVVF